MAYTSYKNEYSSVAPRVFVLSSELESLKLLSWKDGM